MVLNIPPLTFKVASRYLAPFFYKKNNKTPILEAFLESIRIFNATG